MIAFWVSQPMLMVLEVYQFKSYGKPNCDIIVKLILRIKILYRCVFKLKNEYDYNHYVCFNGFFFDNFVKYF